MSLRFRLKRIRPRPAVGSGLSAKIFQSHSGTSKIPIQKQILIHSIWRSAECLRVFPPLRITHIPANQSFTSSSRVRGIPALGGDEWTGLLVTPNIGDGVSHTR